MLFVQFYIHFLAEEEKEISLPQTEMVVVRD